MFSYHLYVSSSRLSETTRFAEVDDLVEKAQRRNETLGLTGALIFTGSRFAQFLEGPPDSVQTVLESIFSDSRHDQITVLKDGRSNARRFSDWTLSYSGPSLYVDRHVKGLVGHSVNQLQIADIERLLVLLETTANSSREGAQNLQLGRRDLSY